MSFFGHPTQVVHPPWCRGGKAGNKGTKWCEACQAALSRIDEIIDRPKEKPEATPTPALRYQDHCPHGIFGDGDEGEDPDD